MEDMSELDVQKSLHSELTELLAEIKDHAEKKLFHQMTQGLEKLMLSPCYQVEGNKDLVSLFNNFVKAYQTKMAPLVFVRFLQKAFSQMSAEEALQLLAPYEAKVEGSNIEPVTGVARQVVRIVKGELSLRGAKLNEAKEVLEELQGELEQSIGVEAFVYSALYRALADTARAQGDLERFYQASLSYLAFTAVESIPVTERARIAQEVAESALMAPNEFNFGELLEKPLIKADLGEQAAAAKLRLLLEAFHEGSFAKFDAVMGQPDAPLGAQRLSLEQKMRLAALMELVFQRAKKERILGFAEIAQQCRVQPQEVELLVMRAISKKLVAGRIDQVENKVTFTWVKPRVLDPSRIAVLEQRIDAWGSKAKALYEHLEDLTPELLVS